MKKIYGLLLFLLGAGGGFAAGYLISKKKYEGLADKEVESVKESLTKYYESKQPVTKTQVEKKPKKVLPDIPPIETKTSIVKQPEASLVREYHDYSAKYRTNDIPDTTDKPQETEVGGPYIITPEEFSYSEYETQTLFYYNDKVIADDDYNVITHVKDMIGTEAIRRLDTNIEMDSIYVRNDNLKIDYEILYDTRNFYDLAPQTRKYTTKRDVEDED